MPTPKSPRNAAHKRNPTGPSEIAPGVYVGSWSDALAFEGERFCVLDEAPEEMPAATHIPIYNEERDRADVSSLDRLATAMRRAHEDGNPVLVFCGHGVRRSPLGAAWYLHRTLGMTLDAAYARVEAVRPRIERAAAWVGNAAELEQA